MRASNNAFRLFFSLSLSIFLYVRRSLSVELLFNWYKSPDDCRANVTNFPLQHSIYNKND